MRRLFSISVVAISVLGSAAAACPWASGSYSATIPPDISFKFAFDETCKTVAVTDTGSDTKTHPLTQTAKGWSAAFGPYKMTFDTKGKRAKASRGGAARNVRMRKL